MQDEQLEVVEVHVRQLLVQKEHSLRVELKMVPVGHVSTQILL